MYKTRRRHSAVRKRQRLASFRERLCKKTLVGKGASMKRQLVLVVLSLAGLLGNFAAGSTRRDATERLQNSADVLNQIDAAPDKGIPEEVVKNSKCIVVIPHLVKGGFIFGAKYGRG